MGIRTAGDLARRPGWPTTPSVSATMLPHSALDCHGGIAVSCKGDAASRASMRPARRPSSASPAAFHERSSSSRLLAGSFTTAADCGMADHSERARCPMSWLDTPRDRYYEPSYVYIAGSLSARVMKIGTTVNIESQEKRLRRDRYGSIDDWVLLYHVWVDQRGRVEHDALRTCVNTRILVGTSGTVSRRSDGRSSTGAVAI